MSSTLPAKADAFMQPSDDANLLQLIRERYELASKADEPDRKEAEKDVDFMAGDQWAPEARRIREETFRPVLSWNRLHTFVAQVVNDGRQNKPSVHVTPADDGDKATSEVLQGRIRQIEYESDADVAYDTSSEQQVICGRGFYRVTTDYASPMSAKQVIKIKPISNQFSVLFDPAATEYDRCDAEYCFVGTLYSRAAYSRKFGKNTKVAQANFFAQGDNLAADFINIGKDGEHVLVCEYWVKEYTPRVLATLENGETKWADELPEGAAIVDTRESAECKVMQYITDGVEILSRTEWLGCYIPIVPVWGREEVVRGRKRTVSLIRFAHDAQRLVNLYVSNIAEQIAMMPKTPYTAYEGTLDGHEDEWAEVNNIPKAVLYVKPVFTNGVLLPPPTRTQQEPPIQALAIGLGQAVDALKAACNIYDASLGNAPADASGVAIRTRNTESDTGNFHFVDNQARSRKLLGRILLELIPLVEGSSKALTVRSVDGKVSHVPMKTPTRHTDGSMVKHDLDNGSYEPHISTGPSYTSQRQEAYAIYSQLAQTDQNFMQIGGDVLFRAMDAPGSDELADRYAKMLPAQLQKNGDPAQAQNKLSQALQMVQQLTEQNHQLKDAIAAKLPELETRKFIVAMQEHTKQENIKAQLIVAQANLQTKTNTAALTAEVGAIQHSMDHDRAKEESEWNAFLARFGSMPTDDEQGGSEDPAAAGEEPTPEAEPAA